MGINRERWQLRIAFIDTTGYSQAQRIPVA